MGQGERKVRVQCEAMNNLAASGSVHVGASRTKEMPHEWNSLV